MFRLFVLRPVPRIAKLPATDAARVHYPQVQVHVNFVVLLGVEDLVAYEARKLLLISVIPPLVYRQIHGRYQFAAHGTGDGRLLPMHLPLVLLDVLKELVADVALCQFRLVVRRVAS